MMSLLLSAAATPSEPSDLHVKLVWLAYYAIGLPIAFWHTRRQGSTSGLNSKGFTFLIFVLACMWPLLLFILYVNDGISRAEKKERERREQKKTTPPSD